MEDNRLMPSEKPETSPKKKGWPIRLDRNELAGAFGDIGLDIPLITAMILASGLDPASVFIIFGLMQILSALAYRIPMPVQPLKAVAALVVAQGIPAPVIFGGGLAIGLVMLPLAATGLLDRLAAFIPKCVVRGIQFGLGMMLCQLALGKYVLSDGVPGYILAGISAILAIWLIGNRKYPPALLIILLGFTYAILFRFDKLQLAAGFGLALPSFRVPSPGEILQGFFLLALPQIPLSIGNSILATEQMAMDLFPERKIRAQQIGLTYSFMNLVAPFFSGIPVCHGSGGMAGHYAFGARTGGSILIYGTILMTLGLFFSPSLAGIIHVFPLPMLGAILFFEGLMLMRFIRDTGHEEGELAIALLVGVLSAFLPYGFLIGIVTGTIVARLSRKHSLGFNKKLSK